MNTILKIIILLLFFNNVYSQQSCHTYTLVGTINVDSGTVLLRPISSDTGYYSFKNHQQTTVTNGKFIFIDSINYPTAYKLVCLQKDPEKAYVSSIFIIDPGLQTISCNADSLRETPKISNNSMKEWKDFANKYAELSKESRKVYKMRDSLQKVYQHKIPDSILITLANKDDSLHHQGNLILLHCTKENPNSYSALWWLASIARNYDPIYDEIYADFSDSLRATPTGLALAVTLKKIKNSTVGNMFPMLNLLDSNFSQVIIPKLNKKNRYTLVDFWFSHCIPCLNQFSKLKKIYDEYKESGFEIIGISIDQVQYLKDWKTVIKTRELDWQQYWDKDAKNAIGLLSIEVYPSNFLLDQNGTIIKRDIKPEELGKILAK